MAKGRKASHAAAYAATAMTFYQGLVRLHSARIATLASLLAIASAHKADLPTRDDHPLWSLVQPLLDVEYREYDAFNYLSDISYLVYGTTLFDTFLSETTRFLFLLYPSALGDEPSIKVGAVLKSRSKYDLLNEAVNKRVRDLSYQNFRDRIKLLGERFGLRLALPSDVSAALDHYSSIRNTIVHDQSFLEVRLNNRGRIVVRSVRCPHHPTALRHSDLKARLTRTVRLFAQSLRLSEHRCSRRRSALRVDEVCAAPRLDPVLMAPVSPSRLPNSSIQPPAPRAEADTGVMHPSTND